MQSATRASIVLSNTDKLLCSSYYLNPQPPIKMSPTILVTGASGFIAAHVVNELLKRGYNVRGTVRSENAAATSLKIHETYRAQLSFTIVPDIAAPGAFNEAVQGVDGVSFSHPYINRASN